MKKENFLVGRFFIRNAWRVGLAYRGHRYFRVVPVGLVPYRLHNVPLNDGFDENLGGNVTYTPAKLARRILKQAKGHHTVTDGYDFIRKEIVTRQRDNSGKTVREFLRAAM